MIQALDAREVLIPPSGLQGTLTIPAAAHSLIVFAHGSGSSRYSPRNTRVARALNATGLATLLFDLLLPAEAEERENVFDMQLLAGRLEDALRWCDQQRETARFPVGLFGASTGAAAALIAAARLPSRVSAVVSRGGRPDLAAGALSRVEAPTLLIVGERDEIVIDLNRRAMKHLACPTRLEIVPGATHLFEEPGTLDIVIDLARAWFLRHLHKGSEI